MSHRQDRHVCVVFIYLLHNRGLRETEAIGYDIFCVLMSSVIVDLLIRETFNLSVSS